jgi:hypothetical protein
MLAAAAHTEPSSSGQEVVAMSKKEQYSSLERGPKKRQKSVFSGAADHGELTRVDRELERLFKEFWESPGRTRPSRLRQKSSVRSGRNAVARGGDAMEDLSAE